MTSFPVHTLQSAPERSKPAMQQLQSAFGMIPNLIGAISTSPACASLARTEGVLAHPPTAALPNSSSRDRSRHPPRRLTANINKDNSNDYVSS